MLSESDKRTLLGLARSSLEAAVSQSPRQHRGTCPPPLMRPSGAFVTLRLKNELRGCIGYLEAARPLVDTVMEVAAKSALSDPRFEPVSMDELPLLELEISVISPMRRIANILEIEIGTHGLLVESGPRRGLLLPQVAVEYGWDRETFLSQASRKAGLQPSAWKQPETRILIFTAEVFSERAPQELHS